MRGPEERIPEAGLRGTHARLDLPSIKEGFDALFYVRLQEPAGFLIEEWIGEV
jgi:hypothetical protein